MTFVPSFRASKILLKAEIFPLFELLISFVYMGFMKHWLFKSYLRLNLPGNALYYKIDK